MPWIQRFLPQMNQSINRLNIAKEKGTRNPFVGISLSVIEISMDFEMPLWDEHGCFCLSTPAPVATGDTRSLIISDSRRRIFELID
jgi:hypothetical protein